MAHCDEVLSFTRRSLDWMPHEARRGWRVEPSEHATPAAELQGRVPEPVVD